MNSQRTTHCRQRSSRLSEHDSLFEQVELVPSPPAPEPIPVGEARELGATAVPDDGQGVAA